MDFEQLNNVSKSIVFRKNISAGDSGYIDAELHAHGFVKNVKIRFAAGENGTLHVRPQVIIPQDIPIDLFQYAADKFVSGDDETFANSVKVEIENHALIRIWYDNTGAGTSFLNCDVEVEYYSIIEPVNIIGPRA